MLFACFGCGLEREIPTSSAWPKGCPECGGTIWTSPPAPPLATFTHAGAFDPAANANALLRQPGSAYDSFRNAGAIPTLT